MNNITNGMSDMSELLSELTDRITCDKTARAAQERGAVPVVARAKRLAMKFRRTGELVKSIGYEYSDKTKTVRIGIGEPVSTTDGSTGYYGRFQDQGFRHFRTGMRITRNAGYFNAAYNAEQSNVERLMINEYEKELNKVD